MEVKGQKLHEDDGQIYEAYLRYKQAALEADLADCQNDESFIRAITLHHRPDTQEEFQQALADMGPEVRKIYISRLIAGFNARMNTDETQQEHEKKVFKDQLQVDFNRFRGGR